MLEDQIQNSMFTQSQDKTFIDKLLGRQDAEAIRKLMRKEVLERNDLNEILNLLSSPHCKLWNFTDWDRHIQLKFFVWVREYARTAQLLYDYEDDLKRKEKTCATCELELKDCKCSQNKEDLQYNDMVDAYNQQVVEIWAKFGLRLPYLSKVKVQKTKFLISFRTKQMLLNNMRQMQHNVKFLVDLYLNIGNTTLSLSAAAFDKILTTRFEIDYGQGKTVNTPIEEAKFGGLGKSKT